MQTGKHTLKIPFIFSTLELIVLKVLPKAQCSLRLRDSFGNINSISKFPIATKIHIFKKWEQMRRQQWVLVSVLQMINWQMYSSPDQKPSGDLIMTVLMLKWLQKRPESQHFWKCICLFFFPQQNFMSINLGLEAYGWSTAPPAMSRFTKYTFPTLTQLHLRTQVYILIAVSPLTLSTVGLSTC